VVAAGHVGGYEGREDAGRGRPHIILIVVVGGVVIARDGIGPVLDFGRLEAKEAGSLVIDSNLKSRSSNKYK
jgi:hypothetical protein